jgi:hypothetical protein
MWATTKSTMTRPVTAMMYFLPREDLYHCIAIIPSKSNLTGQRIAGEAHFFNHFFVYSIQKQFFYCIFAVEH